MIDEKGKRSMAPDHGADRHADATGACAAGRGGNRNVQPRTLSRRIGLTLERTKVGDRYVLERMREGGFNVGGEQSGHMILTDHATTGDGTVAALSVLSSMVRTGKPASELLHVFDRVPQLLKNVRYEGETPLGAQVKQVIAEAESELADSGRR